jgi:flagellar motor switch protein FliN/FliY
VSIDLADPLTTQLPAAATAVTQAWDMAGTLTTSEPIRNLAEQRPAGQAVLVEFTGRVTGELAIAVDDEIAAMLLGSPAAPPDLATALGPAVTAACLAIGDVAAGAIQTVDAASAARRLASLADSAGILLTEDGETRGLVAIGGQPSAQPSAVAGDRLNLLRGVQMQATVELGRTQMTVGDLLSLRSGAVIELDRAAGAPADLYVNGRLIARGEVVVVDENYGLRVMQVVADDPGQ